ncbi:MAG: putative transcriptional regulator [Candidatus Atribacteria bacterium]|nr:putative transcriptional regulator [Candidatus Atribacteria bacterium]
MQRVLKTKLKEFRTKLGLTQEELARRAGVRRETIIHLEKGQHNSSLRLAWEVARILGTTVDELFTFVEEAEGE